VAPAISAFTDEIALPTLRDSSSASSLRFAVIASASACSRRERSVPGVLPQAPSSAARAAGWAGGGAGAGASAAARGRGCVDRAAHVGLVPHRGAREHLAGRRLADVAQLAGSCLDRLAVDEEAVVRGRDSHRVEPSEPRL